MNVTPLHAWHASHHGRMVDFAGWQMPIQYSSIIEEHHAVRRCAGSFDISHMGRIRFTGPDACAWLDHLLTNDVARLKPGQVRYSLICNEQGGILDDVLVYRFEESYLLVVNASNRTRIVAWCQQHQAEFDATLDDQTMSTGMLAVQGPQAIDHLSSLVSVDIGAMKYYSATDAVVCGVPATVSRTGYTGEDGFEVIISAAAGLQVWESILQEGSDRGLVACGLGCRDTLRLEAAMPLYGHEMDETMDPITAGLSFGVKLDAGDFIGREALRAISEKPLNSRRIGLILDGRRIAREQAALLIAGSEVGHVTSGTFSPTLEKSIAMAYVDSKHAAPGTALEVDVRGRSTAATITELPFYSRP